jgi:hypothetical protein
MECLPGSRLVSFRLLQENPLLIPGTIMPNMVS